MKKTITLFCLIFFVTNSFHGFAQSFTVIDSVQEGAYGAAAWGDYDHDGWMDLVYITQAVPNDICIVMHNSSNVFTQVTQHFPHLFNPSVKWADLNNDSFDDLVMNGADSLLVNRTFIYQSNGNGTFTPIANSIMGLTAGSIAIADYNNDGLKDIAVTGFDSMGVHHAAIYKCTGPFAYTDIHTNLFGIHFGEMQWGDYNNDSLPDLVINGIGDVDFRTRIYQNMGADSFLLQPVYIAGTGGTVDWADFDNDGWLDILITGYDSTFGNNITEMHHNNGNGTFSLLSTNLPVFGEPSGVAIADYNNDSIADICFIGGGSIPPFNFSTLALGSGTGIFNLLSFPHNGILNPVVEAADIDNDGDVDLFFNNLILRNDGPVGIPVLNASPVAVRVYPNPANNKIQIEAKSDIERVDVLEASGRLVKSGMPGSGSFSLNLDGLANGVYHLRIRMNDGSAVIRKICVAGN